MKPIKIKDKNNEEYTVESVEGTMSTSTLNGRPQWSFEHRVRDHDGRQISHGHFKVRCSSEHDHLSDKEMFNALLRIGARHVLDDINKDREIESKGYNINAADCRS